MVRKASILAISLSLLLLGRIAESATPTSEEIAQKRAWRKQSC